MKMKRLTLVLMAAALLTIPLPCYAASGTGVKTKTSSVSASTGGDYTQIPDEKTLKDDIGFVPKVPKTLAGGYQFTSGSIVNSYDTDSNGNLINEEKGISFQYSLAAKNTTKAVSFSASLKMDSSITKDSTVMKYGDVELYFNSQYANFLGWQEQGVAYKLMDTDYAVTKDEMVAMAKEIIDQKAADTK